MRAKPGSVWSRPSVRWHREGPSPWLCGPSLAQPLMLMKLLSTSSYLCLTCKRRSFLVSPDRGIWVGISCCCCGKGLSCFLCSSGAFTRKEEGWGRREEHEGRHRLLSMAVSWPCHKHALGATELAAAFQALLRSLPGSSLPELQAHLRLQAGVGVSLLIFLFLWGPV